MKPRSILAALSAFSLLALASSTAHAMAAPPSCIPATMLPRATQPIPANIPGFAITATGATSSEIKLLTNGTNAEIAVTVGPVVEGLLKVAPDKPLTPGTTYRFEYLAYCSSAFALTPTGPLTVLIGPEAPLPSKLGEAASPPAVSVQDRGTGAFSVGATYNLDPTMKPWAGVYQLVLVVDGKQVSTRRDLNAGNDQVSVNANGWCDAATSATSKHTIRLRARLPFAATLESAEAAVDFTCPVGVIGALPNDPPTPPAGASPPSSGRAGGCSMTVANGNSALLPLCGIAIGLGLLAHRRRGARRERS